MAKNKERELLERCLLFVANEYYGAMGDDPLVKAMFDQLIEYFGKKGAFKILRDGGWEIKDGKK